MGFFSDTELAVASPSGCGSRCSLHQSCITPRMGLTGTGEKGILVVAEAPGEDEDVRGEQSVGKAGQRLRKELAFHGIDLERDCWKINAVNCRPPEGRAPTPEEIEACRPNVIRAIVEHNPKLILLLGASALSSVVGHSNPKMAHGSSRGFPLLRGKTFPDRAFPDSWLSCTFHPPYIEKMDFDPVVAVTWRNDIRRALEMSEEPTPKKDDTCLTVLPNTGAIIKLLETILERKQLIAFDYETTGLKPHASGHSVVSVGISPSVRRSYAFKFGHGGGWDSVRSLWRDVLADRTVPKVAHNIGFEWEWSKVCFDVTTRGWAGCTQVLSHLEDSRAGHGSLKVQAYLKFGVPDYTSDIEKYKCSSNLDEAQFGANAKNRMGTAPEFEMLKYNALDALYTMWLWDWYEKRSNHASGITIYG